MPFRTINEPLDVSRTPSPRVLLRPFAFKAPTKKRFFFNWGMYLTSFNSLTILSDNLIRIVPSLQSSLCVHLWMTPNRCETSTWKCVFYEINIKVCVLIFPRYFRYSIAQWVESTGTGGDRSITDPYSHRMLTSSSLFKVRKEKDKKSRSERWIRR